MGHEVALLSVSQPADRLFISCFLCEHSRSYRQIWADFVHAVLPLAIYTYHTCYWPNFQAESNGSIFVILRNHYQGAGGQIDQGQEGLHHVGGGFVQTITYICISTHFWAQCQGSILRIPRNHHQGAGGQVDQGLEGLHHVGGGVGPTLRYICTRPNFLS